MRRYRKRMVRSHRLPSVRNLEPATVGVRQYRRQPHLPISHTNCDRLRRRCLAAALHSRCRLGQSATVLLRELWLGRTCLVGERPHPPAWLGRHPAAHDSNASTGFPEARLPQPHCALAPPQHRRKDFLLGVSSSPSVLPYSQRSIYTVGAAGTSFDAARDTPCCSLVTHSPQPKP